MGTSRAAVLLGVLAAWPLSGGRPALAQDENGPPRRFVPSVYSNRRIEQDEDHTRRVQGTLFKVLENLGDSINFSIFPINAVVGDLELFMRKLDQELYTYGSDRSRYDLLHGDTIDHRHRGFEGFYREIARAYEKLVEKGMIPLGGEAGPRIKDFLARIEPIVEQVEPDFSQEIQPPSRQIDQNAQQLQQAPQTPPQPQPVDVQRLPPILQRTQQTLAQLEQLDKLIDDADQFVDESEQGKNTAQGTLQQLKSQADNIIDADNKAIQKASKNNARGSGSSANTEGKTGPVLRMALERLEDAVKKSEETKKGEKKLTDKDESQGMLKKLQKAVKLAVEKNRDAAQADLRGAQRIDQLAQQIQEAIQNDPGRVEDLKNQANDENQRVRDAVRAAEDAVRPLRQQFQQTKERWRQLEENLLGKIDGGKSEIQGRLPYPLPMPPFRAASPKDPPPPSMAAQQNIRSKGIKYPDALGLSTGEVMRQEGLQERGGTTNCRPGERC